MIIFQVMNAQPESTWHTYDTLFYLNIPERSVDAMHGSDFVARVSGKSIEDRERTVVREMLSGNVPSFSRNFRAIKLHEIVEADTVELIYFVACDYLAIGSDQDYLYIPLTPSTAQYLADTLNYSLPTSKIVDQIYTASEITLEPQPIPPSVKMTTIEVFEQHTDSINLQFALAGFDRTAGQIVAGHKKDIIISNKIYSPDRDFDRVVIYGWHLSENNPIQPVYNGHSARYADYSHGVKFISKLAFINGDSVQLNEILTDPVLAPLLSDEGVISKPYYPKSQISF